MPASPDFPAGPPPSQPIASADALPELIESLAAAPDAFRDAVEGLSDAQLDTHYRNWTPRQIVHHVADSHAHSYLRFKLALTETNPTVRPYAENAWANLADARTAALDAPLDLIEAVHGSWLVVVRSMAWEDFARTFYHPELRESVPLALAIAYYPWHARHHAAQINWLAAHHNWR